MYDNTSLATLSGQTCGVSLEEALSQWTYHYQIDPHSGSFNGDSLASGLAQEAVTASESNIPRDQPVALSDLMPDDFEPRSPQTSVNSWPSSPTDTAQLWTCGEQPVSAYSLAGEQAFETGCSSP